MSSGSGATPSSPATTVVVYSAREYDRKALLAANVE
jgi:hypothetical protein